MQPQEHAAPSTRPGRVASVRRAEAQPPRLDGAMRSRVVLGPADVDRVDPLLALVEDWMRPPGGFPDHPQRGFEALTLVLEGRVVHEDSAGGRATLAPGDGAWTTAGRGIVHSELPEGDGEAHLLRLWVNLPALEKGRPPRHQVVRAGEVPVLRGEGIAVRVVAGEQLGVHGPAESVVPVLLVDADVRKGREVLVALPPDRRGIAYVLRGAVELDGRTVRAGEAAFLDAGPLAAIRAQAIVADARFVLASGAPIGEPVVADGAFVMTTAEEIAQAYEDQRAGRIGREG
jgi:redox-sensitive bicupin YhaK (pirin superfamily)